MLNLPDREILISSHDEGRTMSSFHQSLPADDPTQRKPVIDLAKKELDWELTIMLEKGLKRTIDYFKKVV